MDCLCAFLTTGEAPDNHLVFALLADLNREQCCLRIADMTLIGSEHAPVSTQRGRTSQRNETGKSHPASAPSLPRWFLVERFFNKIRQVGVSQLDYQPSLGLHPSGYGLRFNESTP